MASQIWTFTTSQTFNFTGSAISGGTPTSSVSASIECWGAGGHGNSNGTGGSGGAYATRMVLLKSGSYVIVVGQPTSDLGGTSSFTSASVQLVVAAGGKKDGSISHQLAICSGSTINLGGLGGDNDSGYAGYNGASGGGAGGALGAGENGRSGHTATTTVGAIGGRYNNSGVAKFGGSGAYYYSGPAINQVFPATDGDVPGCGGGGGYDYGTDSSANGGAGLVTVWIDSSF